MKTLGQIAYEAHTYFRDHDNGDFDCLDDDGRDAWESAALAVRRAVLLDASSIVAGNWVGEEHGGSYQQAQADAGKLQRLALTIRVNQNTPCNLPAGPRPTSP